MDLLEVLGVVCTQYARLVRSDKPKDCFDLVKRAYLSYHNDHGAMLDMGSSALVKNEMFLKYVCDQLDRSTDTVNYANKEYPQSMVFKALHEYEDRHSEGDKSLLDEQGLTALQRLAWLNYAPTFLVASSLHALIKHMKILDEHLAKTDLDKLTDRDVFTLMKLMDNVRLRAFKWMPEDFPFVSFDL